MGVVKRDLHRAMQATNRESYCYIAWRVSQYFLHAYIYQCIVVIQAQQVATPIFELLNLESLVHLESVYQMLLQFPVLAHIPVSCCIISQPTSCFQPLQMHSQGRYSTT
jgi:hypothetical protein